MNENEPTNTEPDNTQSNAEAVTGEQAPAKQPEVQPGQDVDGDAPAPGQNGSGQDGQPQGRDLAGLMIELAKQNPDYPYVSACSPGEIPAPRDRSRLLHSLLFNYAARKAKVGSNEFAEIVLKGNDEFKKLFCQGDMIYIRLHKVLPQLCGDGMYQNVPVNETDAGVKDCGWYHITTTGFKPFIVVKSNQVEGGFGMIDGNPYHTLTNEEIAAVLQKQKEREAAEKAAKENGNPPDGSPA